MTRTTRTLIGAVVAATAALTVLGSVPALADPGDGKARERAGVTRADDSRAPDRGARARVTPSAATEDALAKIQARIARYVDRHGTRHSFASYVDSATGRIVLRTDAPANVVDSVTTLSGAARGVRRAAGQAGVRRATTADSWNRRDDIPPYWGGAGLTANGSVCSSGYTVQNGAGTRFSVTAGHCWANGTTVLVESGLRTYGVVSNRRLPTATGHAMDFELLGGQSYAGRVYTGGVTSNTSLPVVGAGTAYVGYSDYCHSGRTTGEQCGHSATSINGQVCTQSGCKSPVIVFTGGTMIAGGDSGGAFYAKTSTSIWIRGNVIASDGITGYAQPWTVIAPQVGVSIVTG
jgi:hypothetical protein